MLRLLRSVSVRLALGYAALFVASSLLLVGWLWWDTATYLDRETAAAIAADIEAIKNSLHYRGVPGAAATIRDRIAATARDSAVYALADRTLKPLAGNLELWPADIGREPGWYRVPLVLADGLRTVTLEEVALPGGFRLLVGRDAQDRAEIRRLIVTGLGWAALVAFVIAVGGGLLVRRAVLRRVETINNAASAIVHGDLSRRLPTRDSSDEFDQLAQTINLMLSRIERSIEGVRNTSNTIAHDLRTPLAELRSELEGLIRARPSRRVMLEGLHKAVAGIDRVISIFNALMRLAEIDSGVRRSGFRKVNLGELATEVTELYCPLAEEKSAALAVDAPDDLAIDGDPHLLAQAVANLVDNAVKYTPRHGAVSLRIGWNDSGDIEIVVADTGPGIPPEERLRVTERFYRCRCTDSVEGIGLGLSLVDAVARLHDGTLMLADNNPGLSATLRLPGAEPGRPASRGEPTLGEREGETKPPIGARPLAAG